MKVSSKTAAGIALVAVIAFAVFSFTLQARPAAGGSFKLPFDAQWGTVSLKTGDYTFAVDHITSNGSIAVYRGNQAVGIVRSQVLDGSEDRDQKSELLCVRHNGKATVRALRMAQVGTFYFALPRDVTVLVAKQPQLIETVSVQVSGQ